MRSYDGIYIDRSIGTNLLLVTFNAYTVKCDHATITGDLFECWFYHHNILSCYLYEMNQIHYTSEIVKTDCKDYIRLDVIE